MDYEITAEAVKLAADRKESFVLLDVREPWEYETARIEGATLIPMGDIPSRAHQELDPEAHIIVYCLLPPRRPLHERNRMAPPTRIRKGPVHGRRNRRVVA